MPEERLERNLPAVIPDPFRAPYQGVPINHAPGWDPEPEEPAVPLSHYLWILKRHRWKILAFVATCVIGFGNGIGSGTMMTLGADLAPREATGEFLGVWRLIGDVGSTGGPLVVGGIADLVGLTLSALTLSGVGVLAAATLMLFVRETLKPPEPLALAGSGGSRATGA